MMNCVDPGPPANTMTLAVASAAETDVTATIWPLAYQLTFEFPGHGMPFLKTARKPDEFVASSVRLNMAPVAPVGTAAASEMMRCWPLASGPSLVAPGRES